MRSARVQDQWKFRCRHTGSYDAELAVAIEFGKKTDPSGALKKAGVAVRDVDI